MIELTAADRSKAGEPDGGTRWRICIAAMKTFADHGSEAASMRMVAAAADVSVGLVQHHFGTKAALVAAVDDELFAIIEQAAPRPIPAKDPVADTSRRPISLIAEHPDGVNYLSRLLADDEPTGRKIFDMLLGISHAHWEHLRDQGGARPDFNPTWSALNPLILVLGTLIVRRHIERQLPEPLASPTQLHTWETAMDNLVGRGQLRQLPD